MKKYLFLLAFSLIGLGVSAQNGYSHTFDQTVIDDMFKKYEDKPGVTSVNISKAMFKLLKNMNTDDSEINSVKPFLNDAQSMRVLVMERPQKDSKDFEDTIKMFDNMQTDISNSIKILDYEELMSVNNDGTKVKLLTKNTDQDMVENLIILVTQADQNVVMALMGNIPMDTVNDFVNQNNR